MNSYQRGILEFLRDEYGVRPSVRYGGKHPYILIEYRRKSHRFMLSSSPSDHRSLANAETQIRRLLGPPAPPTNGAAKRTLEELMDELPAAAPLEAKAPEPIAEAVPVQAATQARVAVYRETDLHNRLNVFVRNPLADRFGRANGVQIEVIDAETFRIFPDPTIRRRWRRNATESVATFRSPVGDALFGSSPAEVVEIDGALVIHCPIATRMPVGPAPVKREKQQTLPVPLPASPPQRTASSAVWGERQMTRESMRQLLKDIALVELGEWRLIKVNGAWRWRMSDVSLDDE